MLTWIKQLLCNHNYIVRIVSEGAYDEESWLECTKCNKQAELEEIE